MDEDILRYNNNSIFHILLKNFPNLLFPLDFFCPSPNKVNHFGYIENRICGWWANPCEHFWLLVWLEISNTQSTTKIRCFVLSTANMISLNRVRVIAWWDPAYVSSIPYCAHSTHGLFCWSEELGERPPHKSCQPNANLPRIIIIIFFIFFYKKRKEKKKVIIKGILSLLEK